MSQHTKELLIATPMSDKEVCILTFIRTTALSCLCRLHRLFIVSIPRSKHVPRENVPRVVHQDRGDTDNPAGGECFNALRQQPKRVSTAMMNLVMSSVTAFTHILACMSAY